MGRCGGEENEIWEGGSLLALRKYLVIEVACGRLNLRILGKLWGKNTLSVVKY